MSTKTLSVGVIAILMGIMVAGCASQKAYYPESTADTNIALIALPEDNSDAMTEYTRAVVMAHILKGDYMAAWNWQVPEGYGVFVTKAGKEEKQRLVEDELAPRWAEALLADLRKRVMPCVDANKFTQARELIWTLPNTDCKAVNVLLRKGRADLLNIEVNVKHWKLIEKAILAKADELLAAKAYDEARAFLTDFPHIRTYTVLFDRQLELVCKALMTLGVPEDKLVPMQEEASKLIAQAFADATEAYATASFTTEGEKPDLEQYEASLKKLRAVLIKYDCDEDKADGVIAAIRKSVEPLLTEYCVGYGSTTNTTTLTELGTTQVNVKIDELVADLLKQIDAAQEAARLADLAAAISSANFEKARDLAIALQRGDLLAQSLIAEVRRYVAAKQWDKARTCIRDYVDFDQQGPIDQALYLLRVGLLDSEVNPAQKDDMLATMKATYEKMVAAGDLLPAREWLLKHPLVIDAYPDIDAAMKKALAEIKALGADAPKTDATLAAARAEIQVYLDKRYGLYAEPYTLDFTKLDEILKDLAESLLDQTNDNADTVERVLAIRAFAKEMADEAREVHPITTEELNAALCLQRDELLKDLDVKIAVAAKEMAEKERREAYERLLAALDKEVGIETQCTIAEDAIARGLPTVSGGLHTVLGDYARAFRLLRNKVELTPAQKNSILVGAAYLNQPAVVAWAIDLGADVNAPAPRDPLARPALLVAIQTGNIAVIRALADGGADMAVCDANGDTTLHYAVQLGDSNVINLALEETDVNARNKAGEPAIFIAVRRNQVARVEQLIKAGADLAIEAAGNTAVDIAAAAGARDVIETLAAAEAAVTDRALLLAAGNDRLAIAQWLVDRGLDVNAEGVMEAAAARKVATATYTYLVSQGGLPLLGGKAADELFFPEELAKIEAAKAAKAAACPAARKAEAEARKAEAEALLAEAALAKIGEAAPEAEEADEADEVDVLEDAVEDLDLE